MRTTTVRTVTLTNDTEEITGQVTATRKDGSLFILWDNDNTEEGSADWYPEGHPGMTVHN